MATVGKKLGVLTLNFTRATSALRANPAIGWEVHVLGLNAGCCTEQLFAYIEPRCFVLRGSLTPVPSGWQCTSFGRSMLIFLIFFFNSPASFHGDDCSFDACAKVKREREIRGRCCIKLGVE